MLIYRKWAAVLDGGQHWALRLETCQEARCEASRGVSAAEDRPALPNIWRRREVAIRDGAYIPREVA